LAFQIALKKWKKELSFEFFKQDMQEKAPKEDKNTSTKLLPL
jgi:hypothetical protein